MPATDYPPAFVAFHEANPWIYAGIVRLARDLQADGLEYASIRYCFEHMRIELVRRGRQLHERQQAEFGLDNNFTSYYARLIMEECEDLKGFFKTRSGQSRASTNSQHPEFDFE